MHINVVTLWSNNVRTTLKRVFVFFLIRHTSNKLNIKPLIIGLNEVLRISGPVGVFKASNNTEYIFFISMNTFCLWTLPFYVINYKLFLFEQYYHIPMILLMYAKSMAFVYIVECFLCKSVVCIVFKNLCYSYFQYYWISKYAFLDQTLYDIFNYHSFVSLARCCFNKNFCILMEAISMEL